MLGTTSVERRRRRREAVPFPDGVLRGNSHLVVVCALHHIVSHDGRVVVFAFAVPLYALQFRQVGIQRMAAHVVLPAPVRANGRLAEQASDVIAGGRQRSGLPRQQRGGQVDRLHEAQVERRPDASSLQGRHQALDAHGGSPLFKTIWKRVVQLRKRDLEAGFSTTAAVQAFMACGGGAHRVRIKFTGLLTSCMVFGSRLMTL